MSDPVQIAIATSTSACVIAFVGAYFAYKAKIAAKETHLAVNSRMDELLKISKASAKAEGKLEGQAEQLQRKQP